MTYNMRVHTAYDLLNSSIALENLYKKLSVNGQDAVVISDPNMYAAIKNYKEAKKWNIHLVFSLEVNIDYNFNQFNQLNISILAKNEKSFYKLLDLSSYLQTEEKNLYLEDFLEKISPYKEDSILIINNKLNNINSIKTLEEEFVGYDYYFSYSEECDYRIYSGLTNVVYSRPSYYLNAEDYQTVLVTRAIRDNAKLKIEDLNVGSGPDYLRTKEDFQNIVAGITDSEEKNFLLKVLEKQKDLICACKYNFDFSKYHLPKYVYAEDEKVFESYTSYDYLKYLAVKGLKSKVKNNFSDYTKRLEYELRIIKEMGFEDYFLIVQDFINYARSQGIVVGDGRGSAAGSLVCYLLGITQADPLVYNLLFERFLNKDRISMPDIDIDFQDTRRDEVIKYVEDKYGEENVAQIITFGTFQSKAASREAARILQFSDAKLAFISKNVSSRKSLRESYQDTKALREFVDASAKHKKWFEIACSLENLPKNKSVHAAGLIISGGQNIGKHTALERGNVTKYLSQWTMEDLEYVGLLKIDFLGIRYLSMLDNISKDIRKTDKDFDINKITYDDKNVYELFTRGDTEGIFQFENKGLRSWLKVLKPSYFRDIYAVTSLYRPGPMQFISSYIERKHGREEISYLHPSLEKILKDTYGIIVYQEQIMQIAVGFAKMSLNEADIMRRAVSKKDRNKLAEYGKIFVEKSLKAGQDVDVAKKLFEQIVTFAEYGFNKSHAVVYSMLAYKLAYLKTYYKKYFMTELLNNFINQSAKINEYKNELNKNKIKLLKPDINTSSLNFSVVNNDIIFALVAIKNVGIKSAEYIVAERERFGKYIDIEDFLKRVDKKVDKQAIISLVKAGALDCFAYNRATLVNKVTEYYDDTREGINDIRFSVASQFTTKIEEVEDYPLLERIAMEKEVTGTYFLKHPVQARKEEYAYLPLEYIGLKSADSYVEIVSIREIKTKKRQDMAFLVVNDGKDDYEVTVFPSIYKYAMPILKNNNFLVLSLKYQEREGSSYILEKLATLEKYRDYCFSNIKQISVLVNENNKYFLKTAIQKEGKGNLFLFFESGIQQSKTYSLKNEQEFVRNYLERYPVNTIKIRYVEDLKK